MFFNRLTLCLVTKQGLTETIIKTDLEYTALKSFNKTGIYDCSCHVIFYLLDLTPPCVPCYFVAWIQHDLLCSFSQEL